MKFHIFVLFAVLILLSSFSSVSAQFDAVIGQVTSSSSDSYAGGISGDGRFVVFESTGNIATENPRNSDNNREIFLFDYAQRRIFQITDTKSLLTDTTKAPTFDNIKVDITNLRPVISNDGKWIAFSSNATCAYPGNGTISAIVSTTNPGNFNANSPPLEPGATPTDPQVNKCLIGSGTSQSNNLVNDGNTELWIYEIPAVAPVADLSQGEEIALTDLSGGTFTRLTNTLPSRTPVAGTTSAFPIIADDNHDSSIDDTGAAVSFTSNRDVVPCTGTASATCGNAAPNNNDEIYIWVRGTGVKQLTATGRGSISNPIYNANSTIANLTGGGWRIAFVSRANPPVVGFTSSNSDGNEEVFYADISTAGTATASKQITTTTRVNVGDVVNVFNYGRRMSRDGRYIAFDSYADLVPTPPSTTPGPNQPGFATFLYDVTTSTLKQVGARSDADSAASGGDVQRYPAFTDYNANRTPEKLVLQTRMNIKADGTIPTTSSEGQNDNVVRPSQIYSTPLINSTFTFTRLGKLPTPSFFLATTQPLTSDKLKRLAFNMAQVEFGTGNSDLTSEVYYQVIPGPDVPQQSPASLNYSTGASRIPVTASPVPTPSPTATPSPTPTPTTTPSPTPTPTPQQPPAVQGVSPGMLAILDYDSGLNQPVTAFQAVGSLQRRFTLPIELSGVTMTINGASVGLKTVGRRQIVFVVPPGLAAADAGTVYPVVVNNNGVVFKGNITVVPSRPDVFTTSLAPGPNGRALIFNSTNRILTREPFNTTTFKLRGSRRVPTVFRLYLTGINLTTTTAANISVRIGSSAEIPVGASDIAAPTLLEPGVYTIDFRLPCEIPRGQACSLDRAGDQPIIVTVTINGVKYFSRLDDTAPRLLIL